jgi:dynein heavy chain
MLAKHTGKQWLEIMGEDDRVFYGDYMIPGADTKIYEQIQDMGQLSVVMNEYLEDYNGQTSAPMPLVLFLDAIEHVSRIR